MAARKDALTEEKQSRISGEYKGELLNGRFEGVGEYESPQGRFVGGFHDGHFHGPGTMHVSGGKFVGTWQNGKIDTGEFFFNDGLMHRKSGYKFWEYCSMYDPRFYTEVVEIGLEKDQPLKYQTIHGTVANKIPQGCYDTVDGYYDPKQISVCKYDTNLPFRMPNKEEKEWIIKNCRMQNT